MGKGDKKSKKGKITIGSFGVRRRRTGTKPAVVNPGAAAKAAPAKAVKKAAPKKATSDAAPKKAAAKKETTAKAKTTKKKDE